jgi:cobalt/nickel transport system ATP-binding protein
MILQFENIVYSYPGLESPVLNGVSLELNSGERVALVGRNGSGKSTLMLIANGILKPESGYLLLDGQPVRYDRHGLKALRHQVGVVFQNPEDQLFSASVLQDISLGPMNLGLSESQARERVLEVADFCCLTALLERPTHALSGGEKTRVALAGILAMEPQFLFADEITNSLDPWMRRQIMDILDQWVDRGHTVVLSTHDWSLARSWPQKVIWMDKGKILHGGTPAQVIPDPLIPTGEWSYA